MAKNGKKNKASKKAKSNEKAMKKLINSAKKQKNSTTVNKPIMKTVTAPAAVGFDVQTYFRETPYKHKVGDEIKDAICVEGCEYLGPIEVPADEVPGAVYQEFYLSPNEFAGTRLSSYAKLYEKYLFKESDFMYMPATGSAERGQLVIAYDRDISDDTPPPTQQGVRQFLAMEDMKAGNVWTPHVAKCPLRAPETGFYTNTPAAGGDERLSYQGQVYVACVIPTGEDEGTALGTLLVRYKCIFFIPQLEGDLEQLVTLDEFGQAGGTNVDLDFLSKTVASNPSLVSEGVQQWLPTLQGDGTYAIKLPEGLYNLIATIGGGTNPGAASTVATIDTPTLDPLEGPAPASAPQMQVQPYAVGSGSAAGVGGDYSQFPATWMGYLNVAKGGALLRIAMNLVSAATIAVANVIAGYNLLKMGSPVQGTLPTYPSPSSLTAKRAMKLGVAVSRTGGESTIDLARRISKAKASQVGTGTPTLRRVPACFLPQGGIVHVPSTEETAWELAEYKEFLAFKEMQRKVAAPPVDLAVQGVRPNTDTIPPVGINSNRLVGLERR